jgi:hypothetical protein
VVQTELREAAALAADGAALTRGAAHRGMALLRRRSGPSCRLRSLRGRAYEVMRQTSVAVEREPADIDRADEDHGRDDDDATSDGDDDDDGRVTCYAVARGTAKDVVVGCDCGVIVVR